jgi:patatin-like phospholipase/acyl hydrolase
MTDQRFQILALDGGGLRGIFSAAILAALEDDLQISAVDHFDLIAGTSTGGIIALGLGLGLRPRQIVEFYAELGERVFRSRPALSSARQLRQLLRAKFTTVLRWISADPPPFSLPEELSGMLDIVLRGLLAAPPR